jgi:hypothetical protein
MSRTRFVQAAAAAIVVNLALHVAIYFLFLRSFFAAHPGGSEELARLLVRPPEELVGWALAVSAVTMGLLITTVMRWAGARTFAAGLRQGAILGTLFWASVNYGIYSSSRQFSAAGAFADLLCSAAVMTAASAVAAWVLGRAQVE